MMWAKDYPLGTVMLGVFDVWLLLISREWQKCHSFSFCHTFGFTE